MHQNQEIPSKGTRKSSYFYFTLCQKSLIIRSKKFPFPKVRISESRRTKVVELDVQNKLISGYIGYQFLPVTQSAQGWIFSRSFASGCLCYNCYLCAFQLVVGRCRKNLRTTKWSFRDQGNTEQLWESRAGNGAPHGLLHATSCSAEDLCRAADNAVSVANFDTIEEEV